MAGVPALPPGQSLQLEGTSRCLPLTIENILHLPCRPKDGGAPRPGAAVSPGGQAREACRACFTFPTSLPLGRPVQACVALTARVLAWAPFWDFIIIGAESSSVQGSDRQQ